MGALHEGHLSLVRAAKAGCEAVVASIFVNPTQFGPNEDFSKYPRTFEADCALLKAEGVDAVFAPAPEEMYRPGSATFVEVAGLSDSLDGASRPGHFRGVATVVAKLFLAAEPDRAYFGQKDAAQVAVLRRMVADLGLPVELVVCPIVREADGLAMSSRNRYLSQEERRQALVLSRALHAVQRRAQSGERETSLLAEAARQVFATEPAVRVDYIAAVDWRTLLPVEEAAPGTLFAVAAWIGQTRLIDNVLL
jgi:pantoate--beta-alanine ligase